MTNLNLKPGDICTYKRSNNAWGFFIVLKIDQEKTGNIYSLKKFDANLDDEISSEDRDKLQELRFLPVLNYFPVTEKRVQEASPKVVDHRTIDDSDLNGYVLWKAEFDKGKAGVFDLPIEQI